jgi:hypothetical protein
MCLEPRVPPWGPPSSLGHNLQISNIQVFYGQVQTRMPFKCQKCYSPTSSQVKVLVLQASIVGYLQDLPSRFFPTQRSSYWWATYEGNFSSVLNQESPIFWFTSSGVHKQPASCEVLAPASLFYEEAMCKGSTRNRLLYAAKQYHKRTTLRTWPWQLQERDAEWLALTIGGLIHSASVLLGT